MEISLKAKLQVKPPVTGMTQVKYSTLVILNDPIQPHYYKIIIIFGGMFRMYLDRHLPRAKTLFHKNQNLAAFKTDDVEVCQVSKQACQQL